MEPAKIDWKNLTWVFVEDERYEHLNAPKWFDLSAPEDTVDDVSWFCRPDCNHPQTAEDFLKSTPRSKKQANAHKTLLLGEMNYQSDSSIKKRGITPSPIRMVTEDSENQNPNLSTPQNYHARTLKAAIKSSSEKEIPNLPTPMNHQTCPSLKEAIKSSSDKKKETDEPPRLKSTLSARNLFGGHNIFSQITEFVGELKNKLASKSFKERGENMEQLNEEEKANYSKVVETLAEKERKPLLQVSEARSDRSRFSPVKEKQNLKRRSNDGENTPMSLNMEKVRPKRQEVLSQIRTSPPTPQGFSTLRGPARTTPQKATKSKLTERQILQELKPSKPVHEEDEGENRAPLSNFDTKETKQLDLFWLLKPCAPTS